MRNYICLCLQCEKQVQLAFYEPYPKLGEQFIRHCSHCGKDTVHTLVLTKKMASELHRQEEEKQLRDRIIARCEQYGFSCRFLYESVIITTPISSWQFNYHAPKKTLRHESTVKINFKTGDYAKTHEQFREQKMTWEEVIDYIAAHDEWRQKQKE